MQTKAKANSIITHERTAGGVAFKFRGSPIGELMLASIHAANRERAMLHGFIQRVGDGGAVERMDKATGLLRTEAEMDAIKRARITALIEHYNSGAEDWNLVRASGGGGGADTSGLTIEAIARVYKWDVATTEAKVDKLAAAKGIERKEMLRTYANLPDVAAMVGTIKAERAARAGLDAASMADELANA